MGGKRKTLEEGLETFGVCTPEHLLEVLLADIDHFSSAASARGTSFTLHTNHWTPTPEP